MTPKQQVQNLRELAQQAAGNMKIVGIPVVIDPEMPKGRVEFKDDNGNVLGAIEGLAE